MFLPQQQRQRQQPVQKQHPRLLPDKAHRQDQQPLELGVISFITINISDSSSSSSKTTHNNKATTQNITSRPPPHTMPSPAVVFGSTGLVGSNMLASLVQSDIFKPVHTIARRAPPTEAANLNAVVDEDTSRWPAALAALSPAPTTAFSALGTTRSAAGGVDNQWKIDHDLNVELAKAAKQAGVRTYVFVSSAGTRSLGASALPYSKMKNGVEDALKSLAFDQAVILKPGIILGERDSNRSRSVEGLVQTLIRSIGKVSQAAQDKIGQDAAVIARAAIKAGQLADEGKAPAKFWYLQPSDIVKLGRADSATPTTPSAPTAPATATEPSVSQPTAAQS